MKCANPGCSNRLLYLRAGSLRLLELEDAYDKLQGETCAFSVRSAPARYFWLCGECSKVIAIGKWTSAGLVLETRVPEGNKPVKSWAVEAGPTMNAGLDPALQKLARSA